MFDGNGRYMHAPWQWQVHACSMAMKRPCIYYIVTIYLLYAGDEWKQAEGVNDNVLYVDASPVEAFKARHDKYIWPVENPYKNIP